MMSIMPRSYRNHDILNLKGYIYVRACVCVCLCCVRQEEEDEAIFAACALDKVRFRRCSRFDNNRVPWDLYCIQVNRW